MRRFDIVSLPTSPDIKGYKKQAHHQHEEPRAHLHIFLFNLYCRSALAISAFTAFVNSSLSVRFSDAPATYSDTAAISFLISFTSVSLLIFASLVSRCMPSQTVRRLYTPPAIDSVRSVERSYPTASFCKIRATLHYLLRAPPYSCRRSWIGLRHK